MELAFTKMHGIGNDYIYVNCMQHTPDNPEEIARRLSPRHFSVGADGLVLILPSNVADFRMRMFNADGSEGKMCGNATRCIGKYVYDNGLTGKTTITLETLSGIKHLTLFPENGKVKSVSVDMGSYFLAPKDIPMAVQGDSFIDQPIEVLGRTVHATALSVGNPHCVIFVEDERALDLEAIGPSYENLPLFPERVNTEFVRLIDRSTIAMRVWERGSGETYACGTGACAAAAAAVLNGHCDADRPITVKLVGGDLLITISSDGHMTMTGPATKVYDGVAEL